MDKKNKYKNLGLSLLFDAIGLVSYIIPGVGELIDVVWAPVAAYLMTMMYKGGKGKIAAGITLVEEAMPGLDVIPTFTLMWLYTYVFTSDKSKNIIEI